MKDKIFLLHVGRQRYPAPSSSARQQTGRRASRYSKETGTMRRCRTVDKSKTVPVYCPRRRRNDKITAIFCLFFDRSSPTGYLTRHDDNNDRQRSASLFRDGDDASVSFVGQAVLVSTVITVLIIFVVVVVAAAVVSDWFWGSVCSIDINNASTTCPTTTERPTEGFQRCVLACHDTKQQRQ